MTNSPAISRSIVHVVSHTHWDREWYHPVGRFRQRLVALIDALLDDRDDVAPFLLDGQAIVLEDYLAVRPERRDELAELASRRLARGWPVVRARGRADSVRRVARAKSARGARGARRARRNRAQGAVLARRVRTSGDASRDRRRVRDATHRALARLWRCGASARRRCALALRPMGARRSSTISHRSGYELGASLPVDADGARNRWTELRAVLAPRATDWAWCSSPTAPITTRDSAIARAP